MIIGYWFKSLVEHRIDSAANIVVLGIAAGYLPWFAMQQRTVFSFYAIIIEPFMLVAIVYCAKLLLNSHLKAGVSQSIVAGAFTLVVLCFLFFLPLFTVQKIANGYLSGRRLFRQLARRAIRSCPPSLRW